MPSRIVTRAAAVFVLLGSPLSVAADMIYLPATPQNTTLADGTALKVVAKPGDSPAEITSGPGAAEPNNHWHWQGGFGNGRKSNVGCSLQRARTATTARSCAPRQAA